MIIPIVPIPSGEVLLIIVGWIDELEVDDVTRRKEKPHNHTRYYPLQIRSLPENSENDGREERGRSQTEGEGHHRRDIVRRVHPKIPGHDNSATRRNSSKEQFLLFAQVRLDRLLDQVMRHRG